MYIVHAGGQNIWEKNNVLPECVYCRYWRTNKIQIKILYELKNIYFLTSEIFCLLYEFNWPVSDKRDGSNADSECNIANYTMLEIGWYQYFTVRKKLGRFFLIFSIFLPLVLGEWYMYVSLAFRALLQLLWMEEQKFFFVCFTNKIHTQDVLIVFPGLIPGIRNWNHH